MNLVYFVCIATAILLILIELKCLELPLKNEKTRIIERFFLFSRYV